MNLRLHHRVAALRRLPQLPPRDLIGVLVAQWHLVRAQVSLMAAPRGQLLAAVADPSTGRTVSAEGVARARRVARAVERAAEYGLFRPTCLVRSIALERMLERDGVSGAVVRIGARVRDGRPQMHAWIEIGGSVIGERPEVASTFTPLQDFTAARRA